MSAGAMTIQRNRELLSRYRRIAVWGGALAIGFAAAIGASWHFHLLSLQYVAIVVGGIGLGACIGYLFFELIIARLITGPSGTTSSGGWFGGGSDAGFSGGGDGGDGGGGGK